MTTTSNANTAPSGRSFPSRISPEVAGVTWSWSKVPVRRSFTIETAVMIVVRKVSTKPKVPDTMKGLPSRRGLKSARVATSTPPGGAAAGGGTAARRGPAGVGPPEREVLHVGREHEAEGDRGAERHGDEDGHREGVARWAAPLGDEGGGGPPPAHCAAPASASTRRKTSV